MNVTSKDPYARMLFLPSLEVHGDIINIVGCTREEAISLTEWHTAQTFAKRKVHADQSGVPTLDFVSGNLELEALADEDTLVELVGQLSTSELPGKRGLRAVYVDVDADEIAVGTTVIYNQNRAMVGVLDDTVAPIVLETVEALNV